MAGLWRTRLPVLLENTGAIARVDERVAQASVPPLYTSRHVFRFAIHFRSEVRERTRSRACRRLAEQSAERDTGVPRTATNRR